MSTAIATTVELVKRNAVEFAETPFLLFEDATVTYGDLDARTDAVAADLASKGVKKGDFVAFMMGNTPHFFDTLLGAQKIGAIGVPISCWWQAKEVSFLVNDCKPVVLIVDAEFEPIVSAIKDEIPSVRHIVIDAPAPMELGYPHECLSDIVGRSGSPVHADLPVRDDVAAVMYTSGTTGQPKGVVLTHKGIVSGGQAKIEQVPVGQGERVLCVLPLFHSGGLNDLAFPCMCAAATIVLRRRFSASEFWECVERYRVNGFYIVPTMWNILLRAPESHQVDTSSLRMGLSGAAPIPPEQLQECEDRFHVPIFEAYGATENTGGITANRHDKRKVGSVGTVLPGMELRIVDDAGTPVSTGELGEIVVSGDTVMKGYLNAAEATATALEGGSLHTGDVGYLDDEGFLFLVDRKKDLIIRGGVNLYPKEIENVIATHPAVESVAVIPEPHDTYGQVAKACVVVRRGRAVEEDELRDFCARNMGAYKVPERFVFRDRLPMNAVGKVIKKELIRELVEEETALPVPVAHLFEGMPARFMADKAGGVDGTVSYRITGGGGGDWTVTIRDGRMTVAEGLVEAPRVFVIARDKDYHDVATGVLDGLTAIVTGKMQVEGDLNFLAELREMMKPLG